MKVLVVDDNKSNRMFLSKLLTSNNYGVVEASNGIEALERVKASKPDLIISDIMMKGMDGFTLLRELKKEKNTNCIPVVFYTAYYVSEKDRELASKLGASRYIIRPAEPLDLLEEIAAVLTEYEAGLLKPTEPLIRTEEEYLKQYSKRIVKKLEEKVIELEWEITERKKAEEQIKQQREFLNSIFESLTHPFYVIDASDHSIVMANPAACLGRITESSKCYTITHGRDKPCSDEHTCPLEEVKKTKKPAIVEHIHQDKDGNARNVEVHGYPIFDSKGNVTQIIEYCLDITESKQAEKEIRRLASIVKFSDDAILSKTLDGIIVSWNPGAEKIYGYSADEAVGKPVSILIPPGDFDELPKILERIRHGETIAHYETKRIKKDGKQIDVSLTISPIKDEAGKIIGASTIARDITERKYAEEVHYENLRLESADKAKSEFLANMSHELRTPLNSIIGFSELMRQGLAGKLDKKQEHFIDNISISGTFLLSLINDILDLSKIEAGKIELVTDKMSVPETIKETLSLIKEKAMKHKVLLKTEFDPELESIEADKQRIKQILFNLLSNAVKFSKEEGGTVTITAKKEGDMAKISVSDTGIGIKEENVGKLFHKFEQLESGMSQKYGGTGLGLAISKKLVELHGGRIWAESRYGEGSTFTFTLPVEAKKVGEP